MNKGYIITFIVILGIFIAIFYAIQKNSGPKASSNQPQLSLDQATGTQQYLNATPTSSVLGATAAPTTKPVMSLDEVKNASFTATIKTSKGDIVLDLYSKDAPQTVQTFISKAETGFYTGLTFHRVEDWVIQGGDPLGNGTGGGNEPVEFNTHSFVTGALGQASRGDGQVQNDSQFFIVKKDSTFLDGKYTNYGQVAKGMDIVNTIAIGDKILGISIEKQ